MGVKMECRASRRALAEYAARAANGRVVVFDTETTGCGNNDEIVEIAAVEYINGERTRDFCVYVNPSCPIDPRAEAVHGLTKAFLEVNGVAPQEALERFFDFLGGNVLAVAHNIRFDTRMVRNECRKFGYAAAPEGVSFCDTLALAKKLVPGLAHYRLGTLVEALGLDGENTHDALDDTLACAELFFNLVGRIPREGEFAYIPDDFA